MSAAVPRPTHVVFVVMENHSYAEVIGNPAAQFINSLARSGALFPRSFAATHPSEPNYLALFSGSTQGLTDDSCPHSYLGPDLGDALRQAGKTFVGYSEGLPRPGFTGCSSGAYARKHAPWVNFGALPTSTNQPFSAFPHSYSSLGSLSFVIPDLTDDMHDGTIGQGDRWLRSNLAGYATWARAHDSLLIVTWDEDDYSQANQIPTLIEGAHVTPGRYSEHLTHYRLLRTLTACLGIAPIGASKNVQPVTDIWHP
jgi:acid phosphatase